MLVQRLSQLTSYRKPHSEVSTAVVTDHLGLLTGALLIWRDPKLVLFNGYIGSSYTQPDVNRQFNRTSVYKGLASVNSKLTNSELSISTTGINLHF